MKFVLAAVVVLAVAMGVQSSLIAGVPGLGLGINGWGAHGLGINGWGAHGLGINGLGLGWGVPGIGLGLGAHGIAGAGWWGAPAAVNINGGHLLSAAHLPAAVNVASGVSHNGVAVAQQASIAGPAATYVAKTRGAIHTAPLAGHINSAASINVAPAPGTW